jgi:hypothetical protein
MTSQGSPYARFKRGLTNGNPTIVLSAAAELPHVSLTDALAISLLLLDKQPERFESAAVRWHSRLCREAGLSLVEANVALAGLMAMTGGGRAAGGHAVLSVLDGRGLTEAAGILDSWLGPRGDCGHPGNNRRAERDPRGLRRRCEPTEPHERPLPL